MSLVDSFVVILIVLATNALTYIVTRQKYQTLVNIKVQQLINAHLKDWQELLYKLNHSGPIPALTTATGLIGLILWGIGNSIAKLKQLLKERDYDTKEVIIDLQGIVITELEKLHLTLSKYLASLRSFLEDYQYKQDDNSKL